MTDLTPKLTITLFFLGGTQNVIFCDDYYTGENFISLLSNDSAGLVTTSVHVNKDIVEKFLVKAYDPADVDVSVPQEPSTAGMELDLGAAPVPPEADSTGQ